MKIYVAAPWVRKEEAIAAGKRLEAEGHEVTSNWFHHPGSVSDSTGSAMPPAEVLRQADEDIADVLRADILIVLNLQKSEGKAVETGIALISEIPFISVGPRSNIFQAFGYEVETLDDAIELLRTTEPGGFYFRGIF